VTVFVPETAPKLIELPFTEPVTVAALRHGVPLTTMFPARADPFWVHVKTNVPPAWSGEVSCHVPFHVPFKPTGGVDTASVAVAVAFGVEDGGRAADAGGGDAVTVGGVGDAVPVVPQAWRTLTSTAVSRPARRATRCMEDASWIDGRGAIGAIVPSMGASGHRR